MDSLSMQHGDIFTAFLWSCAHIFVWDILIQKVNISKNHVIFRENPPAKKISRPFRDNHPTAYLSLFRSTFCKVLLGIFSSSARRYLFFCWVALCLPYYLFSFKARAFQNSPFFLGSDLLEAKQIWFLLSVLITGVWVVLGPCWCSCYRGCFLYPGALVRGFW